MTGILVKHIQGDSDFKDLESTTKYNHFSLLIVVTFCKVSLNTKLVVLKGNTGLSSYEPVIKTFLTTNQYLILFYVTSYVIYIVDSLL